MWSVSKEIVVFEHLPLGLFIRKSEDIMGISKPGNGSVDCGPFQSIRHPHELGSEPNILTF
jgi:hypothetical protein